MLFKSVQTPNASSPYTLVYEGSPGFDHRMQSYIDRALPGSVMRVWYRLYDLTDFPSGYPDKPVEANKVDYREADAAAPRLSPPPMFATTLSPNKHYRIARYIDVEDASGAIGSLHDPECRNRSFDYEIEATPSAAPGGRAGAAVAVIKADGQPQRRVEFESLATAPSGGAEVSRGAAARLYKPGEPAPGDHNAMVLNAVQRMRAKEEKD